MADFEYALIVHDRDAFLARARRRPGFQDAYDALEGEYQVTRELVDARARAGLTQDAVAQCMGTSNSSVPVSRAAAGTHHLSGR